jgi:DNA-binding NarL/FixJ family response regulator
MGASEPYSSIRALLVGDHGMAADGLRRVLRESGDLQIFETADDLGGLADLSDGIQPDVVLMDGLSDGDGPQAASDAQRRWPATTVHAAYDRHWDLLELLQQGQ